MSKLVHHVEDGNKLYYLRDSEISFGAKGMLTVLLNLAPGIEISAEQISCLGNSSPYMVNVILKELTIKNYLERPICHEGQKICGREYHVYSKPKSKE